MIFLGEQQLKNKTRPIREGFTEIDNEEFYSIEHFNQLDPFFMTITSDSNHWMFISSTGGLTAGRINSDSALFPYYTEDKISESYDNTGSKTIILAKTNEKTLLWRPFTEESSDVYTLTRTISKNLFGNKIRFEEVNHDLGLSFSYTWMNSRKYGFIRKSEVKNLSSKSDDKPIEVTILDGLQNLLPAGVEAKVQNELSCLLDAYKRTELSSSSMALVTLSATLTDQANPSEALRANIIWQVGAKVNNYLLSSKQLKAFSLGQELVTERDIKGSRGCFFIETDFQLAPKEKKDWLLVCDVEKDLTDITNLSNQIEGSHDIRAEILADVDRGTENLKAILEKADGMQITQNKINYIHHRANVLFNIMRGGYFPQAFSIPINDFRNFLFISNRNIAQKYDQILSRLGNSITYDDFTKAIEQREDPQLLRLWLEYLPLNFSRRHGDPSRPWNRFSILTEEEDGSPKFDYQGNWRDIFQNWEALCFSYPPFIVHVIHKFLNASTKDGYNPYRISKDGIDWECPEPDNPWANIGYWSDHQIIYLVKLLEFYQAHFNSGLVDDLDSKKFTFAHVPYEIKTFEKILQDPYETIDFLPEKDREIKELSKDIGSDGRRLHDKEGNLILASLAEKLLIHLLTKLGNFIPEGGIWMNTQRPEWNDANNALVGKGISVVTLSYLRRYIAFLINVFGQSDLDYLDIGSDLYDWIEAQEKTFSDLQKQVNSGISPTKRFDIVYQLGQSSDQYRSHYYNQENSEQKRLPLAFLRAFLSKVLANIDHSLKVNRRKDGLYHSYNTLEIKEQELRVNHLYEMLEGQVAILSSGLLSPKETLETLHSMRKSKLYREDQMSYMLYPNRSLHSFWEKNVIQKERIESNPSIHKAINEVNGKLLRKDDLGNYHFHGAFHNSKDLQPILEAIESKETQQEIIEIFESTFNHQNFTGRSGTFFAYEGLGSIYWHMVSKLLLAVQENLIWAIDAKSDRDIISAIKKQYLEIRQGLGYKKESFVYGSFPFDPYSHTPFEKGARQPGMTGQVKEEIITRMAELGLRIRNGSLEFFSDLISEEDLLHEEETWSVDNASGKNIEIEVPKGGFAFTHCQTPIVIHRSTKSQITLHYWNREKKIIKDNRLNQEFSQQVFKRESELSYIEVQLQF